jgi:ribosome-binding protein aMBF1 (putative translation factor)
VDKNRGTRSFLLAPIGVSNGTGKGRLMPHKDVSQTVASRIRSQREARHLTQSELARKLGISYQEVQAYERGRHLNLANLSRVASALDAS